MSEQTLDAAYCAVVNAKKAYEEAASRENIARSYTTTALNALNVAQRAFDAAVAKVKTDNGGRSTDWGRANG